MILPIWIKCHPTCWNNFKQKLSRKLYSSRLSIFTAVASIYEFKVTSLWNLKNMRSTNILAFHLTIKIKGFWTLLLGLGSNKESMTNFVNKFWFLIFYLPGLNFTIICSSKSHQQKILLNLFNFRASKH